MEQIKEQLRELFREGDTDGNGLIDSDEWRAIMKKILPYASFDEINGVFDKLCASTGNSNDDGIDFESMLQGESFDALMSALQSQSSARAERASNVDTLSSDDIKTNVIGGDDEREAGDDLDDLDGDESVARAIRQELESEIRRLRMYIDTECEPKISELKMVQNELDSLRGAHEALEMQMDAMVNDHEMNLNGIKMENDRIQRQNEELQIQLAAIANTTELTNQSSSNPMGSATHGSQHSTALSSASITGANSLKMKEKSTKRRKDSQGDWENQISKLKTDLNSVLEDNAYLKNQLNEAMEDNEVLAQLVEELKEELASAEWEAADNAEAVAMMNEDLTSTRDFLHKRMASMSRLRSNMNALQEFTDSRKTPQQSPMPFTLIGSPPAPMTLPGGTRSASNSIVSPPAMTTSIGPGASSPPSLFMTGMASSSNTPMVIGPLSGADSGGLPPGLSRNRTVSNVHPFGDQDDEMARDMSDKYRQMTMDFDEELNAMEMELLGMNNRDYNNRRTLSRSSLPDSSSLLLDRASSILLKQSETDGGDGGSSMGNADHIPDSVGIDTPRAHADSDDESGATAKEYLTDVEEELGTGGRIKSKKTKKTGKKGKKTVDKKKKKGSGIKKKKLAKKSKKTNVKEPVPIKEKKSTSSKDTKKLKKKKKTKTDSKKPSITPSVESKPVKKKNKKTPVSASKLKSPLKDSSTKTTTHSGARRSFVRRYVHSDNVYREQADQRESEIQKREAEQRRRREEELNRMKIEFEMKMKKLKSLHERRLKANRIEHAKRIKKIKTKLIAQKEKMKMEITLWMQKKYSNELKSLKEEQKQLRAERLMKKYTEKREERARRDVRLAKDRLEKRRQLMKKSGKSSVDQYRFKFGVDRLLDRRKGRNGPKRRDSILCKNCVPVTDIHYPWLVEQIQC